MEKKIMAVTAQNVVDALAKLAYPKSFSESIAKDAVYAFLRNQMIAEDEYRAFANEMVRTGYNDMPVHCAVEELAEKALEVAENRGKITFHERQLEEYANQWFTVCVEGGINPVNDEGFDFVSWLRDNGHIM